MTKALEFQINEYITLKLEGKKTVIYIANKKFIQCKFIVFNASPKHLRDYDSIDELLNYKAPNLDYHGDTIKISPKERFWVHCSSFQAWCDNNYNTVFLDSYLGFPILKKLAEVGDVIAMNVFKEEIAKKLRSKVPKVLRFLLREGYGTYLD